MRCCDCEFRKDCKDEDTVLTAFVRCSVREEKLKQKSNQAEEYVKKSDLKNIGDVPWFDGRNGLNFDQHQTLVACCKAFNEFVDQLPTADVVPKSEVEKLENEVERLTNILNSYALQYGTVIDKHIVIERARDEVAREIFEEIEEIKKEYASGDIDGNELYVRLYLLEKKYTEGGAE